jgi:hypothetical protein
MHDVINAAIANQRVRELVETGETRRTVRDRKRRPEAAKPVKAVKAVTHRADHGALLTAVLRLRRGTL